MIDFNKSGVALVEIVTKPTFKSVEDAVDFCKQIHEIVRTLEIGDVDMEKGQMRLEANISMRTPEMEKTNKLPDYKVEIKNINSFRFMEKAVKAEMVRQSEMLEKGEKVLQENRGFNEATGKTVSQREKEEAHDYRYFPEPDIPPMEFAAKHFEELKKRLPELPYEKKVRYIAGGLSEHEAAFLASFSNRDIERTYTALVDKGANAKKAVKLLVNRPETWELTQEEILEMLSEPKDLISDDAQLLTVIEKVINQNRAAIDDYNKGKKSSIEFLLGQVMRETKGKAKVDKARQLLIRSIEG